MQGLIGSETSACSATDSSGRRKPAISASTPEWPATTTPSLPQSMGPWLVSDARDAPALAPHAGHLAFLDDVHAHVGAGAGEPPGHGIVARGAAARLPEAAEHRIARPVDVHDRAEFLDPPGPDPLGRDALQRVGVGGALVAAHLVMGLRQHDDAAGREHDVVVEILAQGLVEPARLLVDRGRRVLEVVRADDRGVAPGVAAAEPPFLEDADVGDPVVAAEVVGRREPVPARADDDDVVALCGGALRPCPAPALVPAEGLAGDRECGDSVSCPGSCRARPVSI